MMTVSTFTSSSIPCPRCGKPTVVEYKPTVYRCLNCDFEKDLSEAPLEDADWLQVLIGAGWVFLMAALVL